MGIVRTVLYSIRIYHIISRRFPRTNTVRRNSKAVPPSPPFSQQSSPHTSARLESGIVWGQGTHIFNGFRPLCPCNCSLVCRKQHSMGLICKYCKCWSENVREKNSEWYRSTMDQWLVGEVWWTAFFELQLIQKKRVLSFGGSLYHFLKTLRRALHLLLDPWSTVNRHLMRLKRCNPTTDYLSMSIYIGMIDQSDQFIFQF